MPNINILDPSVYNKISAGEVVERPSSVVKELVENALDAGAGEVSVEIREGGIKYIRVFDNGSGMDGENLKKAFLPHATSKIKSAEDLYTISSLGFRGEALASIAAVSILEIVSKTEDGELGAKMSVKDGAFGEVKSVAANRGTSITVNDLFYNTKPRLNFLKRTKTEESYISALLAKFILAYPDVAFTYKADEKIIYQTKGQGLKNAIYEVYGRELSDNLLYLEYESGNRMIKGYVSAPGYYKSNKTYQTLFINGRIVDNAQISLAVLKAYGENIMKHCFPIFILDTVLPFGEVDVNAHPTKSDVRFTDEKGIFGFVYRAVNGLITEYIGNPTRFSGGIFAERTDGAEKLKDVAEEDFGGIERNIDGGTERNIDGTVKENIGGGAERSARKIIEAKKADSESRGAEYYTPKGLYFDSFGERPKNTLRESSSPIRMSELFYGAEQRENTAKNEESPTRSILQNDLNENTSRVSEDGLPNKKAEQTEFWSDRDENVDHTFDFVKYGRVVGQILNCYIVFEYLNDMYLIDQHAVHERINYDRLKVAERRLESQIFMVPYVFSLNPTEINALEQLKGQLNELGFEIEYFGGSDYKISASPIDIDVKKFIADLLGNIRELKGPKEYINEKIIRTACKSSIKSGDALNEAQLAEFIKLLTKNKIAPTCPHGRPVFVKLSKVDLDKMFKRII